MSLRSAIWKVILAATVAAALVSIGADRARADSRAYGYQCCVDAGLTATFDAGSKQITATFKVPYTGLEWHNVVWGPKQDALGHVTDGGSAKNPGVINPPGLGGPTSGQLTFPVTGSGDIFVQVTFQCQDSQQDHCMPGKGGDAVDLDWVLSTPVKVNIGKAPSTSKAPLKVARTKIPKSNGTKACDSARAKIVYANSEIQKVVANINFVNKLNDNSAVQATRKKQLAHRLAQLQAQVAASAKAAAKACA